MTATYGARASRQSVTLAIIVGLHVGAFVLIASGLVPRLMAVEPPQVPITVLPAAARSDTDRGARWPGRGKFRPGSRADAAACTYL